MVCSEPCMLFGVCACVRVRLCVCAYVRFIVVGCEVSGAGGASDDA